MSAEIACPACQSRLDRIEVIEQEKGPRIELYRCPDTTCARRAALVFEPGEGLTPEQQSFVEQEIARHGAFFPSDMRPSGLRR